MANDKNFIEQLSIDVNNGENRLNESKAHHLAMHSSIFLLLIYSNNTVIVDERR